MKTLYKDMLGIGAVAIMGGMGAGIVQQSSIPAIVKTPTASMIGLVPLAYAGKKVEKYLK